MSWSNFFKTVSVALSTASEVVNTVNSVNNLDNWFDSKIEQLNNPQTRNIALTDIAYYIGILDDKVWNYVLTHLSVKALRNPNAQYLNNYCLFLKDFEAREFRNLLNYSIDTSADILHHSFNYEDIHIGAAYIGLLGAYANHSEKAAYLYNEIIQGRLG